MNTLQSLGLTREAVLRIAATFPPPRTGEAFPPEGKRNDGHRCVVLAALLDGEKTTTELATAAGTTEIRRGSKGAGMMYSRPNRGRAP